MFKRTQLIIKKQIEPNKNQPIQTKNKMTSDMFDNPVLCKDCNVLMQKIRFAKEGFSFRALQCPKCNNRIIHPQDQTEFNHYANLRHKTYSVKLRMVGNSYAVSIPREIINFINEQDQIMDEMVKLSFERMGKLSLIFENMNGEIGQVNQNQNYEDNTETKTKSEKEKESKHEEEIKNANKQRS